MKKIFFLVTILSYMAISCNNSATEEKPAADTSKVTTNAAQTTTVQKPPIDWSKYTSVSPEKVEEMATHYNDIVKKNPNMGIRQINMDGEMLEALLIGFDGLKLIGAADVSTNHITMFMQFNKKDVYTYYDINDFFNPEQRGMRGQPVLCPPPETCDLPLAKSTRPNIMTETEADEMSKRYFTFVKANPSQAIRQVTMSAGLLELLTIGTKGLKLIYAVDIKSNIPTVVMQFWINDNFYYFNIREIFTPDMKGMGGQYPLCPPPETCDLPFIGAKKSSKK